MLVIAVLAAAVLAGCGLKNTPAQDLAWERWEQCRKYPSIVLQEIRPDGTVVVMFTNGGTERAAWSECMQRAVQEQQRRAR